jgi:hypothetical protein
VAHNSICRGALGAATYFPNWMNPARSRERAKKSLEFACSLRCHSKVSGESGAARRCLLVDVNKSKRRRVSWLPCWLVVEPAAGQILLIGAPLLAARMTLANRASGPPLAVMQPGRQAGRPACVFVFVPYHSQLLPAPNITAQHGIRNTSALAVPFSSSTDSLLSLSDEIRE